MSGQCGIPDGSLVFSNLHTPFGRWLNRVGPMKYSHVGIVIDCRVYEADWPKCRSVPVSRYGKPLRSYEVFVPVVPFTPLEVSSTRVWVQSQMGRRYSAARWICPTTKLGRSGIYCSEFVRDALNASGRYELSNEVGYDPGRVFGRVSGDFSPGPTWRR